jgi:hypothetical protein
MPWMGGIRRAALAFVVVFLSGACGGGGDSAPDARPRADAAMQTERAYVISRITLPTTTAQVQEAQFEFPGSGIPVNKVGALVQVMLGLLEGLPVQADLDANLLAGPSRQVVVVRSTELTGFDDQVSAYIVHTTDVDDPANPSNDFGGSGQFRMVPGASTGPHWVTGAVDNGAYSAQGDADTTLSIDVPLFADAAPAAFPGVFAQTRGTLTEDGFVGVSASAVTRADLEGSLYPVTARLLTAGLQLPVARAQEITNLFDTNTDGEVTVAELIANPTMSSLTSEDMDLDGDQINDHISQAIHLEMVRAELVP